MKKNIAGIQISSVIGDRNANFEKIEQFTEKIFKAGKIPDIIILPEVWTTGWDCSLFGSLMEFDGKCEDFLSKLAKKYDVNIIGGSYIKGKDNKARNHCPVFNRKGEKIAFYEKIHLYSPDGEADDVESGETPVVVDIEGLKIGLSICYDIRFPELFRSYINSNFVPDVLLNMSAWPKTRRAQYISMAQSRAVENQSYFIALSQTGLIKDGIYNSGFSLAVDPLGKILSELKEEEDVLYAQIDTDYTNEVRKTYPNLDNRKIFNFGFVPELKGELINV